jgi:hypothetical protein
MKNKIKPVNRKIKKLIGKIDKVLADNDYPGNLPKTGRLMPTNNPNQYLNDKGELFALVEVAEGYYHFQQFSSASDSNIKFL